LTFQAYIFDLDGTIYLGDHLLPGARVTVLRLRESGKKVLFLSNKPIENRDAYAKKLTRLGIPTETEDVLNSSFVASLYFGKQEPKPRIYVIGEASLVDELNRAGLTLAEVPEETDVVLISLDRDLTYEKIHFAYRAAKMGARVWATNPDLVCPMPNDEIIDAGATIAALEALLWRPIDGLIGKPSELMIQTVLDHLQLSAEQCVIVGDWKQTFSWGRPGEWPRHWF
jgi:arabinose operon protein AraL